jgi:hypothetical protein
MGEGRNVGKTLLASDILAKFSRKTELVALKITPHKHIDTGKAKPVTHHQNLILLEETDYLSSKDTGRMLAAGAIRSFLLQITHDKIHEALDVVFDLVGKDTLVVCESGRLEPEIKVGLSFFLRQLNCQVNEIDKKLPKKGIDRIVTFTSNGFDLDLSDIEIKNKTWTLKKNKDA